MIIDAHAHMYQRDMIPNSVVDAYLDPLRDLDAIGIDMGLDEEIVWKEFLADRDGLLELMDLAGIDRAIVLPIDLGRVEEPVIDFRSYNRWVFESLEGYEDRLLPFMGVDPGRGKVALEFVEECVKRWDARGIKVYPSTGFYPNDRELWDFWRLAEEYGLVVVSHTGASWGPLDERYCHPIFFREVLESFPSLNIVLAHLGGKWREEAYELVMRYDNAWTDCSALQGWLPSEPEMALARLREMAQKIPDKAFFGTDWPTFDLAYSSARWTEFVVSHDWADEETKEKVFHRNIRKLITL